LELRQDLAAVGEATAGGDIQAEIVTDEAVSGNPDE
jgi:hypothetical protein